MDKNRIRIGKLTVNGEAYPAVINVNAIMRLADDGVDIDNVFDGAGSRRWHNILMLIRVAVDEGMQISGDTRNVPTIEELAAVIGMDDINSITDELADLFGNRGRTVKAVPPKN